MIKSGRVRGLLIVLALLIPLIGIVNQNTVDTSVVWIVYADNQDQNVQIAAETLIEEVTASGCLVKETTFNNLEIISPNSDTIVLIGHGQDEGLEVLGTIVSWSDVNEALDRYKPKTTILLACNSPSNPELSIFGFTGQIDAEAGALMASWKILETSAPNVQNALLLEAAIDAQTRMLHPMGSCVYFVHGYFGSNLQFAQMIGIIGPELGRYNYTRHFSYLADYPSLTPEQVHLLPGGISTYAHNFRNQILSENIPGTQIDIVAHSLGGIITREMLRLYRDDLESAGIEIGRVITAGTPHSGTELAQIELAPIAITYLRGLFGEVWASPIFYSLYPQSAFLMQLNTWPGSYSSGIQWYTLGGNDLVLGNILWLAGIHNGPNDDLVTASSASLAFAQESITLTCDHTTLVSNREDYPYISNWLQGGIDGDQDGLLDVEDRYVYNTNPSYYDTDHDGLGDSEELRIHLTNPLVADSDLDGLGDKDELEVTFTNPNDPDSDDDGLLDGAEVYGGYGTSPLDSDSDNDGLLDGDEVNIYGTLPNAWSTDGDILSDKQEVDWGYDPHNTNDPINAQSLTYSAWQVNGVTGYVRANHYTAMDYVKVYVNYKNSYGQWTGNMLVGTDSTPTYYGDYYLSWFLLSGKVQMTVTVQAFDSSNHYLGCDIQYVTLPSGGGGGKPPGGGDPVPT